METLKADLLILGAGLAGVMAALAAEAQGARVLLASKDPWPAGSTPWAQGGVAIPLDEADLEDHLQDTLRAGRGLVEEAVARSILEEAPLVLERLARLGIHFPGPPAREGGHARARVRHLGGDRTGFFLLQALAQRLKAPILQGHLAYALRLGGGRVRGALLLGPEGPVAAEAGGVVLATGGLGGLFPLSTNPPSATGDGLALAYRAGAVLRDLEFIQFHPTALPNGALVTEALRGAGALLVNARGERFMPRYDPLAELAPRDVVARAVAWERERTGGVFLDARGVEALPERFPTVYKAALDLGLDPRQDLLPVAPAAHYAVGGVRTDAFGWTGLPGLWAVGEVGSTGFHGANRLASNSLLEALVLGHRAGEKALEDLSFGPGDGVGLLMDPGLRPEVQAWAGQALGLVRRGPTLKEALAWAEALPLKEGHPRSRAEAETAHLALLLRLLLRAALLREESRGGHYREDFPQEAKVAYHLEVWKEAWASTPVGGASGLGP